MSKTSTVVRQSPVWSPPCFFGGSSRPGWTAPSEPPSLCHGTPPPPSAPPSAPSVLALAGGAPPPAAGTTWWLRPTGPAGSSHPAERTAADQSVGQKRCFALAGVVAERAYRLEWVRLGQILRNPPQLFLKMSQLIFMKAQTRLCHLSGHSLCSKSEHKQPFSLTQDITALWKKII